MLKEFLRLKEYIDIRWRYFFAGVAFMLCSGVLNGISLTTIVPLMDRIFSGKNITLPENLPDVLTEKLQSFVYALNALQPLVLLKYLVIFIIVIIFLKGVFFYLNNYFLKIFGARILTDLRNAVYKRITTLSMDYFAKKQSGEITTRIIYDVNLMSSTFERNFPQILYQSSLVIIYLVIIFTIDWKLSTISMLIFPPLLYPVFKIGKKLRKLGTQMQEKYGKIGNVINESVYGQQIIKAYNRENAMITKFKNENEKIFKTIVSLTKRILLISPFTEIMITVFAGGIIYYGAKQVLQGNVSSGFLFLFFISLFSLVSPLKGIGNSYTQMKHASSALPRIFSVLEEQVKTKDTGSKEFTGIKETIEFKNINFSYGGETILKNINFSVSKGEKIGIVGPTGVGKTTLIGLILRFYDPDSGKILIDGTDIKEFSLKSLRNTIGFVPQESTLFHDTMANNISLHGKIDSENLEKAVETAGIKDFIETLPDKYNTLVGERGITLSGGQKQLLSIARAVYRNPEILILDEATASLDSNSEKLLQIAMERVMKGRTVFMIAHRLSTLRNVDRIIVLKEGSITEEGSHQKLYDKKGLYYNLWQLQFSS
jgi:ATP-binding cassette, subfamily B, bacterial MsbA